MLTDLVVEGLGVIDRLELRLDPGSTALTGETGAGKTMLVAALGLLAGGRADRERVRSGRSEARVEGRWELEASHPAVARLRERDLLDEAATDRVEVVIARSVAARGSTTRARINGRLVTVGVLSELAPYLIEISGQHEHHRLALAPVQRAVLDDFAGPAALRAAEAVATEVRGLNEARRSLAEHERTEAERARDVELLEAEVAEIEAAGIEPGETAELRRIASRLEHAEAIGAGIAAAATALRGERGAEELVAHAAKEVEGLLARDATLAEVAQRLNAAAIEISDLALELARAAPEPDPAALEATRRRLAILERLGRRYGGDEAGVLSHLADAKSRLDELKERAADLQALQEEVATRARAASDAATELSRLRTAAAPELARRVEALLQELALGGASFEVRLDQCELYEGGREQVEFLLATAEGDKRRPLTKVASGGELSRVALALHLVGGSGADTMVFDEVDAGVGGEAAQAVGRSLAELARRRGAQVLVVTHLPQVAAFADDHHVVRKIDGGGRSETVIERVEGDARVAELSRMLAGLPKSERARSHARELLELASGMAG